VACDRQQAPVTSSTALRTLNNKPPPPTSNHSDLKHQHPQQQKHLNFSSLSNVDIENKNHLTTTTTTTTAAAAANGQNGEDASFLEVLSRVQFNRLDDQRCSLTRANAAATTATSSLTTTNNANAAVCKTPSQNGNRNKTNTNNINGSG
jgi:hypothetical protein